MRFLLAACVAAVASLTACVQAPPAPVVPANVAERPAEKALISGIRLYDDGLYPVAEKQLDTALKSNLQSARDRAAAHKYLAFIYCTSNRNAECEASFRAASQADPSFALSKAEAGHPLWGPVYKRIHP